MPNNRTGDQLFSGVYPTGIMYADRWTTDHGDYVKLAFLSRDTHKLEIMDDCPAHLRQRIEEHAAEILAVGECWRMECGLPPHP